MTCCPHGDENKFTEKEKIICLSCQLNRVPIRRKVFNSVHVGIRLISFLLSVCVCDVSYLLSCFFCCWHDRYAAISVSFFLFSGPHTQQLEDVYNGRRKRARKRAKVLLDLFFVFFFKRVPSKSASPPWSLINLEAQEPSTSTQQVVTFPANIISVYYIRCWNIIWIFHHRRDEQTETLFWLRRIFFALVL